MTINMDSKVERYMGKVVEHLVDNTEIMHSFDMGPIPLLKPVHTYIPIFSYEDGERTVSPLYFLRYCVRQFGLTEEESEYVWNMYKDIIVKKLYVKYPYLKLLKKDKNYKIENG